MEEGIIGLYYDPEKDQMSVSGATNYPWQVVWIITKEMHCKLMAHISGYSGLTII